MINYIPQKQLEEKLRTFVSQPVKSLTNYCDFHFGDDVVRFPIETSEGLVLESSFCQGYKEEKYLAALSAQVGCANQCKFCDLADFGLQKNLSSDELVEQLRLVLQGADKRGYNIYDRPVKATFVMGGDPLNNPYFPDAVSLLAEELPLQLKVSTLLSAAKSIKRNYSRLVEAAKDYPNIVQMQVSLNSTDEEYRQSLSLIPLAGFADVKEVGEIWKEQVPEARKIDLTFTVNKDTPLDPESIVDILSPELFAIRLRELVPTSRGESHGLKGVVDEQVSEASKRFRDSGYDLIPGSPGKLEWDFNLSPGEMIKLYSQIKTKQEVKQK
jgi:23S rRNA (adenine2503-C2)-methyltransferase